MALSESTCSGSYKEKPKRHVWYETDTDIDFWLNKLHFVFAGLIYLNSYSKGADSAICEHYFL